MEKLTLSVQEVAKQLNVSKPTAYKIVNSKGFPVCKLGKRILVPVEAFQEWLKVNTTKVGS